MTLTHETQECTKVLNFIMAAGEKSRMMGIVPLVLFRPGELGVQNRFNEKWEIEKVFL